MSDCLEAAKQYSMLGYHPIPIEPRGKRPLVAWKEYQDMAPAPQQVLDWWAEYPDANVGLVLGRGTFAVDIDDMAAGTNNLRDAGVDLDELFAAGVVANLTAKGKHLLFKGSTGDRVGVVPGVDIRGVGYIVAPPSIHPSGVQYRWNGGALKPLTQAPASLLRLLHLPKTPAQPAEGGGSWVTDALAGVAEGGRDAACTRLAGYLWGKGMPQEVVEAFLQSWAVRCTPAFPPEEVTKCVESIAKREGGPTMPPSNIAAVVSATLAEIGKPKDKRRPAATTNMGAVDELLSGGFYGGEFVLLGGRPGVGKTALALQWGRRLAKSGQGVLIVSREMTPTQLTRRLLSQETGVRLKSLKTGELVKLEQQMLLDGAPRLSALPMWITSGVKTPGQLAQTLQDFEPGQLGLAIVDYLQLMRSDSGIREIRQRVEDVSEGLKAISVDFDLPVLCLSSLRRPPQDKPDWKPGLGDLRDSGELEHDADIVLFLHNEELIFAKNRDGTVGSVRLRFHGDIMQFDEAAA